MNILITGITGFSGSHLAELLKDKEGYNIFGTIRGRCRQTQFIDHILDKLTLLECDLKDNNSVYSTIKESEPDIIYHLAAQTFVPTSWRAPQETMDTNVLGTLNLLECIRKSYYDPKILIAGSSEEYGLVKENETPIKESNPLRPMSPYAVSKIAQDFLGYQYHNSYGMKVIRTRTFNLLGPRSGDKIASASFAKQLSNISKGLQDDLMVGNLDAIRDLNDIRDVVRAYHIAVDKCKIGDIYNISTGIGISMKDMLTSLIRISGLDVNIVKDENRIRPSDVPILIGDSSKFRKCTGWKSEVKLEDSLRDIYEYWKHKDSILS